MLTLSLVLMGVGSILIASISTFYDIFLLLPVLETKCEEKNPRISMSKESLYPKITLQSESGRGDKPTGIELTKCKG